MTTENSVAKSLVAGLSEVHARVASLVSGLDDAALAWIPTQGANSISTIVIHLLGSEAELLRLVKGLPAPRDRDAEFQRPPERRDALLLRIDEGEHLLQEIGSTIGEADLQAVFIRPSAVRNKEPHTGLFWLTNGYGHAREHLAHIELTRQLWERTPRDT